MKPNRVFAIRMGGWVELRAAAEPPKRVGSRVKREGSKPEYDINAGWPYSVVDKPFTFYLRVTVYEGGQYLGSVKSHFWSQKRGLFGMRLPAKHEMVELPPHVAAVLLTKRGRREYLGKRS